jgi:hypothetical protein
MQTDEVHALSMKTFTPAEWASQSELTGDGQALDSRRPAAFREIRISGAKNAALPELCAACSRRAGDPAEHPAPAGRRDHAQADPQHGATAEFSPDGTVVIDSSELISPRRRTRW